jgi:hypothetical protein
MDADDERIRNGQGGYNCGVLVDPANPDIVYTFNTSAYKSTDGGATFTGFRGAPGGDDPQTAWIDPTNGRRILLGYDQGAIVTLDGGATWSLWYNQSTEQVYHISADNSFPYWVYATQQDAGAIRTRARGDLGEITPLDWSPVDGWEWGTIVPDPLDHNTVYASGIGLNRINMPTGQWVSVSPNVDPALQLRLSLSGPIVFAPRDQHELLAGYQYLMATTDRGARHAAQGQAASSYDRLHCAVTRGRWHHMGWNDERADQVNERPRSHMDRCPDSKYRISDARPRRDDRSIAVRLDDGIRGGGPHRGGRLRPSPVSYARLWRTLGADHERAAHGSALGELRPRRAGGPKARGTALRRDREWDVGVVQ